MPARKRTAGELMVKKITAALDEQGLEPTALEREFLSQASAVADLIAALENNVSRDGVMLNGERGAYVNPAVTEARQQRMLLRALLSKVDMTDPGETQKNPAKVKAGQASARQAGRSLKVVPDGAA